MIRYTIFALLSGFLAGVASYLYGMLFQENLFVDYSQVITTTGIFAASMIGCVLATVGYVLALRVIPKWGDFVHGFLFAMISFASLVGVFALKLPESDDESFYFLIYGMAIPMHFFPVVVWQTLKPLFVVKN